MTVLLVYLLAINVLGFALMGDDKARARRKKRRIPESRLFLTAFLGGALGVLLGMNRFRHKTLHTSFRVGVPLLLMVNAAAVTFIVRLMD
ncbi:DUF1294 domain-containing protein [Gorillibacterium timonense]|uniref:DUF1294 domain-containing protein n=1 Tax=Gorillibacterium timonense TaxID=1689269 RepID=UPI00071C739D|nr:DUF1294 domain-containing protein [Gorillibacterium timonense]